MSQSKVSPAALRQRLHAIGTARATRKWLLIALTVVVVFGLLVYFGGPPLIRHQAEHQLSQVLGRPVTVGKISLNPYTLNLEVDQVHIGEPDGKGEFIGLKRLVVRPSWMSLFRLAPVVNELFIDSPSLHIVRTAPQRFNFSDLIDKFTQPSKPDNSKPMHFSVSNIRVENGRIDVDDKVLGTRHTIDQWQLGIPFIANVPSQADIFVQPLLRARVDGSTLALAGKTKPFSTSLESDLSIKLDKLDLPRLISYLPAKLPVVVQKGLLSTDLDIQFARAGGQPSLRVGGTVDLGDLSIKDHAAQPVFDAAGIHLGGLALDPLHQVFHLAQVAVQAPVLTVARDPRGALSLSALAAPAAPAPATASATPAAGAAGSAASAAQHASAASTAAAKPAAKPAAPATPLDLAVQKFTINNGTIHFTDHQPQQPVDLTLKNVALAVSDFSTLAHHATTYTLQSQLAQGGTLASDGSIDLAAQRAKTNLTVGGLALPTFQPYLETALAGRVTQGTLDTKATLQADWSGATPQLQIAPAELGLDGLRVAAAGQTNPALELAHATVQLQSFDLAARTAALTSIDLNGLVVNAKRQRDGQIDLAALLRGDTAGAAGKGRREPRHHVVKDSAASPAAHEAPWHYQIGSLTLDQATLAFTDQSTGGRPVALRITPLQLKVQNISDDVSKPWQVDVAGTLNRKGSFKVGGALTLTPLKLALRVDGKQLDVASVEPYFGAKLNASVASAFLNLAGKVDLAQKGHAWQAAYDGDAALDNVRMLDKRTADLFAGWRSLSLGHIKARYDARGTDVSAGRVALNHFYARVILDQNGRLNLSNVVAQPAAPNQSLTRSEPGAAPASAASAVAVATSASTAAAASAPAPAVLAAASTPAAAPAAHPAASGAALNLHFGEFLLQSGRVNYTDNFIKPNFTANLVDINGKVGAFGTHSTQPAAVAVKASLDSNGPVSIDGTINPLIEKPALDMTAQARDIELTSFTPYSTKYTGYPITEGRLNVDLHYQLENEQLKANNHIFIDQLTFGDHVDNTTETKLPVRLAIALLKNSRGQIDVNVPVSGSLSDPQFSVGSLIWHAVLNLLERAVTAPFSLLANAFGGGTQNLEYVAFAPGSATLSPDALKKLDTLAKALTDKPAVHLEVVGRVDPALDTPALRAAYVDQQVRRAKIKDVVGNGESVQTEDVKVAPDEYDKYLKRAYKAGDFKKPRNLIGLAKSLPPEQMKKLMADNAPLGDSALRELAQQRANAVRQWFDGKVPPDRVAAHSPKLDASGIKDKGPTTRVDFLLH